jgi:protease I
MVIAHEGFRDEEYTVPKALFEIDGFQVVTASSQLTPARSKFGESASVDLLLRNIHPAAYEAIVFVGGPGTHEYFDDPTAHQLAKDFLAENKWVAAICIAPVILCRAGILTGKNATVFPSGADELKMAGVHVTGLSVTIDGHMVTGSGPEAAEAFAKTILECLKSQNRKIIDAVCRE